MDRMSNETPPGCNESPARPLADRCPVCDVVLERRRTGRPRRFCSPAHRVRHHRQRAALSSAEPPHVFVAATVRPPPTCEERVDALEKLGDWVTYLDPLPSVAPLQRLADYAANLVGELEAASASEWVLDEEDCPDFADDLDQLRDQHALLHRLADLEDLVLDAREVATILRRLKRHRSELDDAVAGLEEERHGSGRERALAEG